MQKKRAQETKLPQKNRKLKKARLASRKTAILTVGKGINMLVVRTRKKMQAKDQ